MPIKDRDVHGRKVDAEDDAKHGVDYLDHLIDRSEADVFFEHARMRGKADFEDQEGRNFTLIRDNDGTYRVERRKSGGSGWF